GGRDYVAAARVLGVGHVRLLWRYVLPNLADTLVTALCAGAAATLLAVSSLSFLGLGGQPPDFDWGRMLVEGVQSIYESPVAALAPAVMIAGTGLALGAFGDALARAMNPLLRSAPRDPRTTPTLPGARSAEWPESAVPLLEVDGLTVT